MIVMFRMDLGGIVYPRLDGIVYPRLDGRGLYSDMLSPLEANSAVNSIGLCYEYWNIIANTANLFRLYMRVCATP